MKKILSLICAFSFVALCFAENITTSKELENKKDKLYTKRDNVLYYLDSGMLSYYEDDYMGAIDKLSKAEQYISDYYTKSITQNIAGFLTNDTAIEYPGEDYEDIYINLIKTIAYYKAGKWEEGFHELNAYRTKTNKLKQKHQADIERAKDLAKISDEPPVNVNFYDSALAEYLFLLYYRTLRDTNLVNYSERMIKDIFRNSPDIYDFNIPTTINKETSVKSSDTYVNFVILSGTSAQKIEKKEIYSNELVLSLPELYIPQSEINLISVILTEKNTNKVYELTLEKIEDIGNIEKDIFKTRSKLIYYKSVARSITKAGGTLGTGIAGDVLSDSDNAGLSIVGGLLTAASSKQRDFNESTERADLRHSKYLPGRVDVGGLNVEPGKYSIEIRYYNLAKGKIIYTQTLNDVDVKKGKLNLVSASSTLNELKKQKSSATTISSEPKDFDKFYFDLGTEPEASASTTFGLFQYNWNKQYSSSIKGKYITSTETDDKMEGYGNATVVDKHKEVEIDLLPFIYNCLIDNKKQLSFSAGASYQYMIDTTFAGMFDVNGIMLDPGDEGKYFTMNNEKKAHIIALRVGVTGKLSVHKNFVLNCDLYINPVYLLILDQDMKYHSDQTTNKFDYGGTNSVSRVSSPYVDFKFYADCFNFSRLVTQLTYQRLDFQQMNWASDFNSLTGYDDVQNITNFRIGIELLAGKVSRARVKGGVYYQNEWNVSSYTGKTEHKDKWIICIGTER